MIEQREPEFKIGQQLYRNQIPVEIVEVYYVGLRNFCTPEELGRVYEFYGYRVRELNSMIEYDVECGLTISNEWSDV